MGGDFRGCNYGGMRGPCGKRFKGECFRETISGKFRKAGDFFEKVKKFYGKGLTSGLECSMLYMSIV